MSADDNRLIADCLQGNTQAFGELVHRYQERLYHSVYRMVDNAEDAQDLVQEAFLNAYQALEGFKGDARFFTWLYRIAVNLAITHMRKHRSIARMETLKNGKQPVDPYDPSEASRPEHAMEQAEEQRRVREALARLSSEHRAVLVMKDIEGQKYGTMAEIMNVPIGTIRSRLHRARLELRGLLEESEREK